MQKHKVPYDETVELAVLGAILIDNETLYVATRYIDRDDFYIEVNRAIFAAAEKEIKRGRVFDANTCAVSVAGDIDLSAYVKRCLSEAASSLAVESYAASISEMSARRKIIEACDGASENARQRNEPLETISEIEELVSDIRFSLRRGGSHSMRWHANRLLEQISEAHKKGNYDGVPWPLKEIDIVMSGPMEVGNLYGLLAASGEGKSAGLMQVIRKASESGCPTLMVSYDQTPEQCIRQMCSQALEIDVNAIRAGRITDQQFDNIAEETQRIYKLPLEIEKLAYGKVARVVGLARSFVRRLSGGRPALVVVDHIKRVQPERLGDDAGTRVNYITSALKTMAEELRCAVLLANQRNSRGFARFDPRPIAEDLFGGQAAKDDYDAILTLHRPSMWLAEKIKVARDNEKESLEKKLKLSENRAEFGALKNRWGDPTRVESVEFKATFTKFVSYGDNGQGDML